jgi:hypothetical protein
MSEEFGWTVERHGDFEGLSEEFLARTFAVVWCNVATVDGKGRPRSRILHPYWEATPNPVGWILTRRQSFKESQLANNPFVSCAYIADITKPIYAECRASWVDHVEEKERIWNAFRAAPAPMGYDPGSIFSTVDDPGVGLLRLDPWRIQIEQLPPGIRKVWVAPPN